MAKLGDGFRAQKRRAADVHRGALSHSDCCFDGDF